MSGSETVMDDGKAALPSPSEKEPGLAQLMGAVRKMESALDGAEAARKFEGQEHDLFEGRLRRTQVGTAVRQLTDAMAHEIGSPLNTILGRARLGAARADCPAEIRTALETIALQAERIRQLVEDMLRVTRPQRLLTGVCDLAAVAEQVIEAIEAECQRANVPMRLERQADSASVGMDAERAFQIVVNACLSAVEAQPGGGSVTLRIRAEDRGTPGRHHILLEVEDQGRTPAEASGAAGLSSISRAIDARGFGLMIARGLVVESGGLFELRPGAKGGAVCQFTFPSGGGGPLNPHASSSPSMERTT